MVTHSERWRYGCPEEGHRCWERGATGYRCETCSKQCDDGTVTYDYLVDQKNPECKLVFSGGSSVRAPAGD